MTLSQKDELVELIVQNIEELGDQEDVELPEKLGATTPMFGEAGFLDSMSLVSLVVAIEQSLEERYGKTISLADEKALSRQHSPYRTIETLAEYAAEALDAE